MKIWSNIRWFCPGLGFSQPPNQIWERFSQKSIVSGLLRCHLKSPVECRCYGNLLHRGTITKWNDNSRIIQRRNVPCQGHITKTSQNRKLGWFQTTFMLIVEYVHCTYMYIAPTINDHMLWVNISFFRRLNSLYNGLCTHGLGLLCFIHYRTLQVVTCSHLDP